jgi:hypothetical protein
MPSTMQVLDLEAKRVLRTGVSHASVVASTTATMAVGRIRRNVQGDGSCIELNNVLRARILLLRTSGCERKS